MTDQKSQKLYINGPISLTEHYNVTLKRWVYIFGEVHYDTLGKCPTDSATIFIDQFFHRTIVDNRDKIIDVFLEFPYTKDQDYLDQNTVENMKTSHDNDVKELYELAKARQSFNEDEEVYSDNDDPEIQMLDREIAEAKAKQKGKVEDFKNQVFSLGGISRLRQLFQLCISTWQLGICPYRNVRVHLIDVRQGERYKIVNWLFYSVDEIRKATLLRDQDSIKEFKGSIEVIDDIWPKWNIPSLLESTKILKQLDGITNPKIRDIISGYFISELEKLNINRSRLYKFYELLVNPETSIRFDNTGLFSNFSSVPYFNMLAHQYGFDLAKDLSDFVLLTMDFYTMARLFRKFSDGTEANYSMFYCGDHHARNYRDILILLDFKLVNQTYALGSDIAKNEYGTRCLDISRFSLPPFTVTPK